MGYPQGLVAAVRLCPCLKIQDSYLPNSTTADTRTDQPLLLGHALLQHQHIGVTPSSTQPLDVLPLTDPTTSTVMPESWVR
jgi:hypothetical protein